MNEKDRFLKVLSDNPNQYENYLEALSNAPQVKGDTIINSTPFTGDIGEIEEIQKPLPAHLESITKPFKRGNEYFLRRPERHELIYVGPKQPRQKDSTLPTGSSNLVTQPNNEVENNPFLQAPADFKK